MGVKQFWSDERVADLKTRFERGDDTRDIASHFSKTTGAIKIQAFKCGFKREYKPPPSFWTEDRKAELKVLWERGDTIDVIASYFGVTESCVSSRATAFGYRRPKNRIRKWEIDVLARAAARPPSKLDMTLRKTRLVETEETAPMSVGTVVSRIRPPKSKNNAT